MPLLPAVLTMEPSCHLFVASLTVFTFLVAILPWSPFVKARPSHPLPKGMHTYQANQTHQLPRSPPHTI